MKKIDKLIVSSFIPPFIMAFFIALFVLVMQFLWKFIDEIIGKGLTMFDIGELLMYRSISLFPLALPIGVLLAGVLVFGDMSEKYELSSLKSAGVSLIRILMPAIVLSCFVGAFSFYCSNTLNPIATLKFQARLYDIRIQKPALNIVENIFNEDFKGFSIRVSEKEADNRHIKDVLIYDNTPRTKGKIHLVSAKSGEMYYSEDSRFFVMELFDGEQYQEVNTSPGQKGLPFMRTTFKKWRKEFDMGQFEKGSTDEELFTEHPMMMSVGKLSTRIDTLKQDLVKSYDRNLYEFGTMFKFIPKIDSIDNRVPKEAQAYKKKYQAEKLKNQKELEKATDKIKQTKISPVLKQTSKKAIAARSTFEEVLKLSLDSPENANHFIQYFKSSDIQNYGQRAKQNAKSVATNAERNERIMNNVEKKIRQFNYELHSKFSLAMICVVFLFIGGPMGAIVRKGGYGYPLLIAIFFFTAFIILTIMCKKLSDTNSLDAAVAAWTPVFVMAPIGIYLTVKAMNDSKLLNVERYLRPLMKFLSKRSKTE